MDLYFLGISFPHLILFDIDKFSELSGEGNGEILRETIFDRRQPLQAIKELQTKISETNSVGLDELRKVKKNLTDEEVHYIAKELMLQNNYSEAEKCYRQLNDYSALKFL